MYMTKIYNDIESHSYKVVHDKNIYQYGHSKYKIVHDKKHIIYRVNSTRKMMKFTHNDKGQCDIMND